MPDTDILISSSSLSKLCSSLQSNDKKKRKNTLLELRHSVFSENSDMTIEERIQHVFKSVLRCLSDQVEACRELALTILLDIVKYVPEDDVQYLTYIIPVLLQRLGCDEIQEKSEEIRLSLMEFIHFMLRKFKPSDLACYVNDLLQIFTRTIVDPFPKVKTASCECVSDLAKTVPAQFYSRCESVVKPLLQNFSHQHSKVRFAAIAAIGNVVRHGNNKCVQDVVVPLAERLFDQAPIVRREVCRVVGFWLLELPDRYSYFQRILPLMLTSLSDPVPELRKEAWDTWHQVGLQYMRENEKELKDKVDYLQEESTHYPTDVPRPNLGCRTLVERNLCHIVPALVRELDDWLVDIRIKSSELMCCLVLHSEENIVHHVERLLVGMYRASNDEDNRVTENVERAAEFLGYFVPPETYCKLILPTIEDSCTSGHLRILAGILRGSQRCLLREKLPQLAAFLHRPEICQNKKAVYQVQLIKCCKSMMTICQEDCRDVDHHLFGVLITVIALTTEPGVVTGAKDLLEDLRQLCGFSSSSDLFKKHIRAVLEDFTTSVDSWSLCSPQRFIFEALLLQAGEVVGLHFDIVIPLVTTVLNPNSDGEMRLKMFTVLSTILQDPETLKLAVDAGPHMVTLINDAFIPNLVWHAGRTAEAIRTAAVVCLATVLENPPSSVNSAYFLNTTSSKLVPQLVTLVEDSSKRTRLFTLRAIIRWVSLLRNHELYKADDVLKIFPVVLGRLDDIDDEVRCAAVKTLSAIFKSLPCDFDVVVSKGPIEVLFETLILHLDDHNDAFRTCVLAALKEISVISPELLLQKVNLKKHNLRNTQGCDDLLLYLNTV
ncbi:dynein axonemal assembly factor 5 [Anabrus simplex]|uniref:dynein axonemal assembly factor 5 n=1 Tax=Anabrus simplex TaxID=316456 RepID=UPI0035A325DF